MSKAKASKNREWCPVSWTEPVHPSPWFWDQSEPAGYQCFDKYKDDLAPIYPFIAQQTKPLSEMASYTGSSANSERASRGLTHYTGQFDPEGEYMNGSV
ncbi:hypothetical protein M0657_009734 [Pyricularia oryzae]|uniref:Uncharacterized protein n=1 Tax=Pyricularia grisea TaxID=148305 RepID=A0A6P8BGE6_PYRGI|nr:uncharacterized protein PgNI_01086 [Pyricularia grisea]KAI7914009.1 hypothetical protein M0657_009734 [Pyricularia oryzae]TLD15732.1 hypothetical protein PgNI_01086 [Pyricularia grisea]